MYVHMSASWTIDWTVSSELLGFCLFLVFPYFFVTVPCARLSWPSRQLLSARKYTVSYRIVAYRTVEITGHNALR